MEKRILALLFIFIVFLSLFSGFLVVAQTEYFGDADNTAIENPEQSQGKTVNERTSELTTLGWPEWLATRIATWELGAIGDQGLAGTTLKYFVLALIILLVYSALTYANFPDSYGSFGGAGLVRFLISLIVGLIATFAITTSELLTMMQSYTALGITLSLFFPILILAFFTLVTARAASPIGIFAQKILWAIYSFYLFLKTSLYLIIANSNGNEKTDFLKLEWPVDVANFFIGEEAKGQITSGTFDPVILTIMLIVSIVVFFIFVIQNKAVDAWITKEARDAEIEAEKAKLERSHSYDELRSQQMQRNK